MYRSRTGWSKEESALLILGMDTTTKACSVALVQDNRVVAEYSQILPKTHSEKLMPLLDALLTHTSVSSGQLDAVAVAAGPGSFTGLRIGVSTARAVAQGLGIPAIGIGTLEALARSVPGGPELLVCPMLDARKEQVYAALYRFEPPGEAPRVLIDPVALSLSELLLKLEGYTEPVVFPGDAAEPHSPHLRREMGERYRELPFPLSFNRASLVAWAARGRMLSGKDLPSYLELKPFYLRASEAERRLGRQGRKKGV